VHPKFRSLPVHGSDGGYLVEMWTAQLSQPCLSPRKAQQWVVLRQLVLDSSMDVALVVALKIWHLQRL